MVDKPINEIYDDTICKYTLNIPRDLYRKIAKRTARGTKYGGRKSTFIRELLENALADERVPTPAEYKQLSRGKVTTPSLKFKVWWKWHTFKNSVLDGPRIAVVGPAKRYQGFIDTLQHWPALRRWHKQNLARKEYVSKK